MAFHWDRANRLLEQTQRRVYGSAAQVLRRGGGGMKIFRWGVSPSKKAQGTAIHVFSYTSVYSNQRHLHLRRPPFLPYGRQYNTMYSTYTNGKRTNRIRPGRSVISLSFPTLPEQPGLTVRYSALLYLNSPSYILVLLVAHHRGFMYPYKWLSALIGCRR